MEQFSDKEFNKLYSKIMSKLEEVEKQYRKQRIIDKILNKLKMRLDIDYWYLKREPSNEDYKRSCDRLSEIIAKIEMTNDIDEKTKIWLIWYARIVNWDILTYLRELRDLAENS